MEKINHNSLCETETHKVGMTDNEIVKSLESLLDRMRAYESQQASIGKGLVEDIISMYNRQKAEKEAMLSHIKCLQYENDKLRTRNDELNALNKTASQEAIKEFAERLKALQIGLEISGESLYYIPIDCIDNLVKEMTEQRGERK